MAYRRVLIQLNTHVKSPMMWWILHHEQARNIYDTKGLASLHDALGDNFVRGVVVYTGREIMPMGDRIFAVPIGMMFDSY